MKKVWYLLALLAVFMVVIIVPKMGKATSEEVKETVEQSLPTVGTVEKLRSILTEAESSRTLMGQGRGLGKPKLPTSFNISSMRFTSLSFTFISINDYAAEFTQVLLLGGGTSTVPPLTSNYEPRTSNLAYATGTS